MLRPVSQNLFGLLYLRLGTGKIESQFSGPASDFNFDSRQTATLHSQVELFVSFSDPMMLETGHGSGSVCY